MQLYRILDTSESSLICLLNYVYFVNFNRNLKNIYDSVFSLPEILSKIRNTEKHAYIRLGLPSSKFAYYDNSAMMRQKLI